MSVYKDRLKHRTEFLLILLWFTFSSTIISQLLFQDFNGLNHHNNQQDFENDDEAIPNLPNPSGIVPFNYYKIITIDHTKVNGLVDLRNFPLLLSIIDSDLDDKAQSDGDDIAFASDEGWLDHEIELYNPNYTIDEAQLIAWIRIPLLSTSMDTTIFMFYGNSDIESQENPSGVWIDYVGVWHFTESSGVAKDSTTYNVNGSTININYQETGQIGYCFNWTDGESSQVNYGDPIDEHLDFGAGNMTVSLWVNLDQDVDDSQWLVSKGRTSKPNDPGFIINSDLAPTSRWRFALGSSPTSYTVESNPIIDCDEWNYIVGTVDRLSDFSYIYTNNGSYDNRIDISGLGSISNDDNLILPWNPPDNGFDGLLDEFRLSNIYRTEGWINTEYSNQYDPNSFYSISIELSDWDHPPNAQYFAYYKEIVIDHTKVSGSEDLLNFPVLISTFDEDLQDKAQIDGDDITFSDGWFWLDYEIEYFENSYNSTHAKLVAWVLLPRLSASLDTVIRMYYGNLTMESRENPERVWSLNYEGVWHLSEDPTGTIYDSTSNNNDCTSYGSMNSGDLVTGKIDGSLDFDGNNDYLQMENLIDQNTGTYSLWLYPHSVVSMHNLLCYDYNPMVSRLYFNSGGIIKVETTQTMEEFIFDQFIVTEHEWYHIVFVRDGDIGNLYVNGSWVQQVVLTDSSNLWVSCIAGTDDAIYMFDGNIDEVRISNDISSTDWIATEYINQYDPNSFYSIGIENSVSDWDHPSNAQYFAYYKEIIINHTKISGSEELRNFPVLVSTFDEDLHDKAQIDGDDIAFSIGLFWLKHEIELFDRSYNSTHAQLVAWVRLPQLSTSVDTIIRMYYGNLTMESCENPEGVWGSNYEGIWHLSEDPTGTIYDSTSNNRDCTSYGSMNSGDLVTGKIDGSLEFDGFNDYIQWDNVVNQTIGTYSLWLYPHSFSNTPNYIAHNAYRSRISLWVDGKVRIETDTDSEVFNFDQKFVTVNEWHHITFIRDGDIGNLYINGSWVQQVEVTGADTLTVSCIGGTSQNDRMVDGIIDEVRISNYIYSTDWIATEYNNQYNPQSFLTIGSEESLDKTPPTFSNLMENSDPLELGNTEVISINVSDPSGINQIQIEFGGSNHSMINIGEDMWQYNSWIPTSIDNYTYTIWMEDNYNNWNSTMGIIEVIDTTSPSYSDLIESANPLQLGQNETITIKVYDTPGSGVNQVLLEYDSSNHTMMFIGGNTWSWGNWKPKSIGAHTYKIYMNDIENNWNMTNGTINIASTTAPGFENHTKIDPLELGNNISIIVDVFDNETSVDVVLIEIDGVNYTISNIGGNTYEYNNKTRSYVGIVYYTIYANDTDNNWNSFTSSFDIVDTTPPAFSELFKSADLLELGNAVIISVNSTDLSDINQVKIEFEGINHSMTFIGGNKWLYDLWNPSATGNYSFKVWAEDINNNWGNIEDSVLVQDITLPMYSDLDESAKIIELGDNLIISINCTDLAGIKDVSIEYENSNHTMSNIGGDIWQYNAWMPTSIGNYTYKIYITDNNDNRNSVDSSILFQDTILPLYTNVFEKADPLELGDNQIIRIDVYDIAGINHTLIEYEGANHSMINIYGNTWQYELWTPTNWITYQYKIHIEDLSGNWNLFVSNITVQDTIAPLAPTLTNNPSGDVSGILVFDWLDGYDLSGISHYILIIDNETNPLNTPGYIFEFIIPNTGPNSSFFELSEVLVKGTYYFFLSQIDGVGHQSVYTMGAFKLITLTAGSNNFLIYIIIGVSIAAVAGLIATATIVKKRTKNEILPQRKKISFKEISAHINKLSGVNLSSPSPTNDFINILSDITENLKEKEEFEIKVTEIKNLGEELFAEGAYLEAQKQFKLGRDLLINLGRGEQAKVFTDLISEIEELIIEREKRLIILEQIKLEGNSRQIFDMYQDIIEISKKLRDPDSASLSQSELILYFQNNQLNISDLEKYKFELKKKADILFNNNFFEKAAEHYEKCVQISELLVQLERENEVSIIEEYRNKKNECLNKINNK
ncbi:MAG: LamG-like jellyroll fold domain-containing protein [Promethearchaeota archaeon]